MREAEPQLNSSVVGGWWFPEDASVDSRRLTSSLRAACAFVGVQIWFGEESAASSVEIAGERPKLLHVWMVEYLLSLFTQFCQQRCRFIEDGKCNGVRLNDGRKLAAHSVVIANGSWMRELLPVPITPHKGQSFSLRMKHGQTPLLNRVLFSQDTYVVPKADGTIIVGSTVEPGSFDAHVTPAGMMYCMSNAIKLVPSLANLPILETWGGLRPTTPDNAPILGKTPWENMFVAGGYWRNGVLLCPKTGQLIADLVGGTLQAQDEALLNSFSWSRFTCADEDRMASFSSR